MNKSTVEGVFDQAKGKVKQAVGEAMNNQSLANEGAGDQLKGHAKEAWGNVKDTARNIGNSDRVRARMQTEASGDNLRKSVTSAAANVTESINRGLSNLENKRATK